MEDVLRQVRAGDIADPASANKALDKHKAEIRKADEAIESISTSIIKRIADDRKANNDLARTFMWLS